MTVCNERPHVGGFTKPFYRTWSQQVFELGGGQPVGTFIDRTDQMETDVAMSRVNFRGGLKILPYAFGAQQPRDEQECDRPVGQRLRAEELHVDPRAGDDHHSTRWPQQSHFSEELRVVAVLEKDDRRPLQCHAVKRASHFADERLLSRSPLGERISKSGYQREASRHASKRRRKHAPDHRFRRVAKHGVRPDPAHEPDHLSERLQVMDRVQTGAADGDVVQPYIHARQLAGRGLVGEQTGGRCMNFMPRVDHRPQ